MVERPSYGKTNRWKNRHRKWTDSPTVRQADVNSKTTQIDRQCKMDRQTDRQKEKMELLWQPHWHAR